MQVLLIFSKEECLRVMVPKTLERAWEIPFSEDVVLCLRNREGSWYLQEYLVSENAPLFYKTGQVELCLFLSERVEELKAPGKLQLSRQESLKIGSSYQNPVFYQCFSFVEGIHMEIVSKGEEYILIKHGEGGLYLNGKAAEKEQKLVQGDRIDLYGMHMVLLHEVLIICLLQGVGRVAKRENMEAFKTTRTEAKALVPEPVENYCPPDRVLHVGEIEVQSPLPRERINRTPLLLGLGPSVTMMLPVMLMSFMGSQNAAGTSFYYLSAAMSLCSCMLALFWGLVNHFYEKHQWSEKEKHRVGQYREYLEGLGKQLEIKKNENRVILEEKYPPAVFFTENGLKVMQSRYYLREDFLFMRIGTGSVPFQILLKKTGENRIVSELLSKEAGELINQYQNLSDVPVGIDLKKDRLVGLTGSKEAVFGILGQLLFQIAACCLPAEVKVACFYQKEDNEQKQFAQHIKWMPHIWSFGKRCRFMAGDESEAAEIIPLLTKEIEKERGQKDREHMLPRYLILVLDKELLIGEPIYQHVQSPDGRFPVSALFLGKSREEIPAGCTCLLKADDADVEIISYGDEVKHQQAKAEYCSENTLDMYFRSLAAYHSKDREQDEQIPESISFLEMYGCTRTEELDSKCRWEKSRPQERLKIPIGVRGGGSTVCLDIHEKFHGPHGLIAGTTGSGKSELIQTWLLSMAVSFSPVDINFFMIDYKGGGTGNALKALPHCSGIISNLSGKQIKRAMSAISSENKRRQQLLNEYQVNHVDKYGELYRRGKAREPMPHLLLVVDEFAELKKEEPEFMQEIISLAQVGRSLGMHLVLATQKPAGTVDDKIWSNARFRLCLRVQDKQDSMDMLHKQDAALLTLPGQCYLQIGNHEYYELFQTAYCGGIYNREGEEKSKALLVTDTGMRIKEKQAVIRKEGISQLEAVIDYVNQVAVENHYERAHSLWLEELPKAITPEEVLSLSGEEKKEGGYLLGLCDDPGRQQQYPVFYLPERHGHLAVIGGPATGKTTLLQTLLWQMLQKSVQEVRLLLVDMSGSLLRGFDAFPHCFGLLKEKEEKSVFFYHLEQLFYKRKKQLEGLNFYQYKRARKEAVPEVFLVIDGYGSFAKVLNSHQEELMLKIAAEGVSYGIYLMIAASSVSEVPGRLFEKVKKTIALEMSDKFAYGDILRKYHMTVFPADDVKGRGLCKEGEEVLEFQTALLFRELQDFQRMERIEKEGRQRQEKENREGREAISRFPVIPGRPDSTGLYHDWNKTGKKGQLPLGYNLETGQIEVLEPEKQRCFLISGDVRTGKRNYLAHLINMLLFQGQAVVLYDAEGSLESFREMEGVIYLSGFKELQKWRQESSRQGNNRQESSRQESSRQEAGKKKPCLMLNHMWDFIRNLYGKETELWERQFWEKEVVEGTCFSFMAGICPGEDHYEEMTTVFFKEFVREQWGIHLGGNTSAQRILRFDDLGYTQQTQKEKPGKGYLRQGQGAETRYLKLPLYQKDSEQTGESK